VLTKLLLVCINVKKLVKCVKNKSVFSQLNKPVFTNYIVNCECDADYLVVPPSSRCWTNKTLCNNHIIKEVARKNIISCCCSFNCIYVPRLTSSKCSLPLSSASGAASDCAVWFQPSGCSCSMIPADIFCKPHNSANLIADNPRPSLS
jgi:hypothetical protein